MMNERTKTGLEILQSAVLLGVLGDVMLRQTPWGLNVFLFIGALVAAMAMLFRRHKREFWSAQTAALNAALVFFAAMFVWRDSPELLALDFLAILSILAVLTLPSIGVGPQLAGVFHYFVGFLWSGINAAVAPFLLLFNDVRWKTIPQDGAKRHVIAVLRGLAIAAPLVFVFGLLFVAADAVFQNIVERTFHIDGELLFTHALGIGFLAWITAGYLRGSLIGNFSADAAETLSEPTPVEIKPQVASVTELKDEEAPKTETKTPEPEASKTSWRDFDNSFLPSFCTLGAVETGVVLGLVNLLFLSFVIVQLPYLFGGFELVQQTPDFKLAEYARRGFGELVAVAALVLPMLLTGHWLLKRDQPAAEKIYRALALVQIVLLFVIMASAAQRLFILTGNLGYGLTTVRFYPMVFMLWLGLVFVWFAATVLRGARQRFAWGALWSALFVVGALHVFNPDAYIARTNLRLMQEGRMFDASYNASLSDDALSVLLPNLSHLNAEEQNVVIDSLSRRYCQNAALSDFRSWNLSRYYLTRAIEENNTIVERAGDCRLYEHKH